MATIAASPITPKERKVAGVAPALSEANHRALSKKTAMAMDTEENP
jgi:hypothetical protein